MIGNDWTDLFDVIITKARKPAFFKQIYRYYIRVLRTVILDPDRVRLLIFILLDNVGCQGNEGSVKQ